MQHDIQVVEDTQERFELILFRAYIALVYVISLRGLEELLLNLTTMKKEVNVHVDCVIIILKGKVKGKKAE